jgi:hypothetical protein
MNGNHVSGPHGSAALGAAIGVLFELVYDKRQPAQRKTENQEHYKDNPARLGRLPPDYGFTFMIALETFSHNRVPFCSSRIGNPREVARCFLFVRAHRLASK